MARLFTPSTPSVCKIWLTRQRDRRPQKQRDSVDLSHKSFSPHHQPQSPTNHTCGYIVEVNPRYHLCLISHHIHDPLDQYLRVYPAQASTSPVELVALHLVVNKAASPFSTRSRAKEALTSPKPPLSIYTPCSRCATTTHVGTSASI